MARLTSTPKVTVRNGTSNTPPMPVAPTIMPMIRPATAMAAIKPASASRFDPLQCCPQANHIGLQGGETLAVLLHHVLRRTLHEVRIVQLPRDALGVRRDLAEILAQPC